MVSCTAPEKSKVKTIYSDRHCLYIVDMSFLIKGKDALRS